MGYDVNRCSGFYFDHDDDQMILLMNSYADEEACMFDLS